MVDIVIDNVYVKKQRNIRKKSMKICKHSDFRYISGIFDRKKNFLKNRTRPCFEQSQYASLSKKSEKLMVKSWENAQKPVFPVYFRHFRPEKYFFRKSDSVTF